MAPITDKDFDDILYELFGEESNREKLLNFQFSYNPFCPSNYIKMVYQQKELNNLPKQHLNLESVAPQKTTEFLTLARGNRKHLLRQLYLKEHWLELCFTELARKNSMPYMGVLEREQRS